MNETIEEYLNAIENTVTIFATSYKLTVGFWVNDLSGKDVHHPYTIVYFDFNHELNTAQKKKLDSIMLNWSYSSMIRVSNIYRYCYIHKNMISYIRDIDLKKLVE